MNLNENASDYIIDEENINDITPKENKENISNESRNIKDILLTKTGDGNIDDYTSHPLNFNGSESISQILRGLTGFLGALDLALIDISMGIFRFFAERRQNV